MINSRAILPTLVAITIGASACSDNTVEPEDTLTEQEATNLLDGYRALLNQTDPTVIAESATGAIVECPLGGQAEVTGAGREEQMGDTARIHLDARINPNSCRVSAGGEQYVLTGDPNVHEQLTVEIIGFFESFKITGTTVGAVAWESGDRSGTCEIDLALAAQPDPADPNSVEVIGTLTGMLCGHQVSIDVTELPID